MQEAFGVGQRRLRLNSVLKHIVINCVNKSGDQQVQQKLSCTSKKVKRRVSGTGSLGSRSGIVIQLLRCSP